MRPARMVMWDCAVHDDFKAELVGALQKEGVAQIDYLSDDSLRSLNIGRDRPLERVTDISMLLIRVRKVLDSLRRFENLPKKNMLEDFLEIDKRPKIKTGDFSYKEIVSKAESELAAAEELVKKTEQELESLRAEKSAIAEETKRYERISTLGFDTSEVARLGSVKCMIGAVKKECLAQLNALLVKRFGREFVLESRNEAIAVAVKTECAGQLSELLREVGFEKIEVGKSGKPAKVLGSLKNRKAEIERQEAYAMSQLKRTFDAHYKNLLMLEELLQIEKGKCEVFDNCGRTKSTTVMRMWAPKKTEPRVDAVIARATGGVMAVEKDRNPRNAPIMLDNPRIVRPFEGLTKMFALPRYNELDPTMLMAPTFAFFFGIMLTDAVYGAILMLMSLFIYKRYGKVSQTASDASVIIAFCGLGAVIFGALTGSYLGDFVGKYAMAQESGSQAIAIWMDPLYQTNAMVFLAFSCAVGLIHIFSGFLIGAADNLHRGEKKDAAAKLSWYVLIAGIALVALSSGAAPILPGFTELGLGLLAASLIIQFFTIGKFFFMGVIGVLGNTLSYARLLAMALTTSGIAISFNFLAALSINIPLIGIFLAVLIFLAGHTLNILLNTLGGFVGSLRLHYVEYFGAFYEGGGREFRPFKEERRITLR